MKKKITQNEYDALPTNEYGIKQCPGSSDYSDVEKFGEFASFGKFASFGESASFGKSCNFEGQGEAKTGYPILTFAGFGSENRTTYAFNLKKGIFVRCGCFFGTLAQFQKQIKETHGDNRYAKDYLLIVKLIKQRFAALKGLVKAKGA